MPTSSSGQYTPETIARRRQMAEALMGQGMQVRPMNHWLEGVGQLAQTFVGARNLKKADEAEQAGRTAGNELLAKALQESVPGESVSDRNKRISAMLMGNPYTEDLGRQLAVSGLQGAPASLERVDLGDRIGLMNENGDIVRELPKGASPDTTLREEGEDRRWSTPSGNTRLTADVTLRGQDITSDTARRGQDLNYQGTMRGQDVAMRGQDIGAQTERDKLAVQQREKLSDTQTNLDDIEKMRQNVHGLLDSKGFSSIYGKSRFMSPSMLPGGAGADAEARRKQLEAASFGISIQKMRGLGALSNAEGMKVTQAYTRAVDPTQSEEAAREAWEEVVSYLELAELRAKQRAGVPIADAADRGDATLDIDMQRYLNGVP